MSLDNLIKLIEAHIAAAQEHLGEIEAAMSLLETAGMYPAVPHFQWQRRDEMGEARYLYLVFRQNGNGAYMGPDGKKKVYIGASEGAINEAKRLTRNRERYDRLFIQKNGLRGWILATQNQVGQLETRATHLLQDSQKWPKTELSSIEAAAVPGQCASDESAVSI